jgi:hypothetical protein
MKLAVMQPYFFPYLGYFQLINAVDTFVFYDDVNFIKSGWINRNRLFINDKEVFFSVPLSCISSFKKINETKIKNNEFFFWRKKFFKTLDQGYQNAPFYSDVRPIITEVLDRSKETISDLAKESVIAVLNYLDIDKSILDSANFNNSQLKSVERILDICKRTNADEYINLIGGQKLYDPVFFEDNQIDLKFISSNPIYYEHCNKEKINPYLSIIDVLMYNSKREVQSMITEYTLV